MSPPRHVLKCKREARLSVSYGRDISSRDRAVPSCLISRNSGWSVSDRVDLDSLRQSAFTASPFRLNRSINCICTPLQLSVWLINADPAPLWNGCISFSLVSLIEKEKIEANFKQNKRKDAFGRHRGRNNTVARSAERVIRIFPPFPTSHRSSDDSQPRSRFLFPSFFPPSPFFLTVRLPRAASVGVKFEPKDAVDRSNLSSGSASRLFSTSTPSLFIISLSLFPPVPTCPEFVSQPPSLRSIRIHQGEHGARLINEARGGIRSVAS